MLNIEQAIKEVSGIYQSLTGKPIQPGQSELPPEVDPRVHVEARYRMLKGLLEVNGHTASGPASGPAFAPPADVLETEREVRVEIDLPGVSRDECTVSVSGDMIVIRGERPNGRGQAGMIRYKERPTGSFLKTVALPLRARREGIEATLRDGVLSIVIPADGTSTDKAEMPIDVK
jgi:HSP20 family protein